MYPAWIAWGNWIGYGTLILAVGLIWYLAAYRRRRQKR